MTAVSGIGNIPGGPENRPARGRIQSPAREGSVLQDGVEFSEAARTAASVTRVFDQMEQSQTRTERVEAAKMSIQEGSYRVQAVVEQVASRISPYL